MTNRSKRAISSIPTIKEASYCSPNRVDVYKKTKTCLTLDELRGIGTEYNKNNGSNKIPIEDFRSIPRLTLALQERFQSCKDDSCWIEQDHVKSIRNTLINNFRPVMPSSWVKDQRKWLNTDDIYKVMQQYEDDIFKFLGVFPVDFNQEINGVCISQNMCKFNAAELMSQGITQFGVVFNLDRHDQPGSHWVSCFCDMDPRSEKYGICYYDSGGMKPPKYIHGFLKEVKKQVEEYWNDAAKKKTFVGKYNCVVHQNKNTECGIFAMLFIISCKEFPNETYHQTKARIPVHRNDDLVHKFRYILYRPKTS